MTSVAILILHETYLPCPLIPRQSDVYRNKILEEVADGCWPDHLKLAPSTRLMALS